MTTSEPENSELLRRAGTGDPLALEKLLRCNRERLKRMIRIHMDHRLAARFDASDVVQETLLQASQRLTEFARAPKVPIYVWLRQIARDRLSDLYERHLITKKRSVLRERQWGLSHDSVSRLADQFADAGTSPSGHAMRAELRQGMHQTLQQLPDQDREILVMRHLEQMSVGEIAAASHVSEGAVKMRCLRAVQRLRVLMNQHNLLP